MRIFDRLFKRSSPVATQRPPAESADAGGDRDRLLIAAVANGSVKEVRSLLERGADANAKDAVRTPALNTASKLGNLEIARALLEHSADTESRNAQETSALMAAAFRDHIGVARLLLENGANREACAQGETAFSVAAQTGHQVIMELLVPLSEFARKAKKKADQYAQNKDSPAEIGVIAWFLGGLLLFVIGAGVAAFLYSIPIGVLLSELIRENLKQRRQQIESQSLEE